MGNNLSTIYLENPSLYIAFEENILLIKQAADEFVKKDGKRAFPHANLFYRHTRVLFGKLHVRFLERNEEKLPNFALFFATKIL